MTRIPLHNGPTQLRVRPVFAQHQIQPRVQFPRHCHFGESAIFARRQAMVDRGNVDSVSGVSRFGEFRQCGSRILGHYLMAVGHPSAL